jgi:hypothetical protein
MAKKKNRWIAALKMDEGAFSAKAKGAGKSTQQYASEKKGASGRLGKQARLALVFAKLRKKRK